MPYINDQLIIKEDNDDILPQSENYNDISFALQKVISGIKQSHTERRVLLALGDSRNEIKQILDQTKGLSKQDIHFYEHPSQKNKNKHIR